MADLTLRLVKGTPLTNQEVDDNFSNLNEGQTVAGEPMGHADKAQSTLSFDSSTRTVTIAPVGAEFVVWCKAEKYVFTTAQTVQIPNTTGIYYIYFNASGVLSYRTTYFDWPNDAPTAYVYWNATTGTAPFFADERHGITLDWQTHEYLHRTRGAALANGFSIANYTTTGTGSADADAQFDLSGGTFFDEDLQVDITATSTPVANTWQQDLTGPAQIPVFYRSGTSWVRDTPTNFVLKAGTATPRYNTEAAGVWGLTDVPNNSYSNVWILATNNLTYPVIAIMGQYADGNASNVENREWSNLNLDGFPVFEFRPLYKIVFQCSTNYANTIKARFTKVFDIRNLAAASVAATIGGSHSTLSGLGSDDHLQYLHISEVRTPSAAVTNSFLPVQAGQTGKYLTTDGSNPSWGALPSSSLTFTGDVTGSGNTGSSTALTLAASGVSAGTYGSATSVPVITVDTKGRLTSVSTSSISGSLSFTGDVTGLGNTGSSTTLTLANSGVTAGSYGDANNIPQLTVDAKGRVTAVSNVAVNIPSGSLTFTGDVTGTGSTGSSTALTLANSGVAAGTYTKVTVDAKGRVTTGAALASGDLPTYTGSLISSQITNALGYTPLSNATSYLPLTGGNLTGNVNIDTADGEILVTPTGWRTSARAAIKVRSKTDSPAEIDLRHTVAGVESGWHFSARAAAGASELHFYRFNMTSAGAADAAGSFVKMFTFKADGAFDALGAITQNSSQVLHAGNYNSYSPTLTGTGASGTWGISISGNASSANTASGVGSFDNRTIAPASYPNGSLYTGFTSWANNNTAPYADYLHLNSYSDSSGGQPNLVTFRKDAFGMRIWRQTFGSGTAYSSYVDMLHSSNYSSYALPLSGGTLTGSLLGSTIRSQAMIRATGWYSTNSGTYTGLGTEIGISSGEGYVIAYNRDTSAYGNLNISGTNISLLPQGGSLTRSGNTILDAGNYTSYSLPLSGGTLTGDLVVQTNWSTGPSSYSEALTIYGTYPSIAHRSTTTSSVWLHHMQSDGAMTYYYASDGAGSSNWAMRARLATDGQWYLGSGTNLPYLHANNYSSYALPLTGGTLTGTIQINTTGSGSSTSHVIIKRSGASAPGSFGSYSGSWRSAIEIWNNDSTRMLFLNPPESDSLYANIKSVGGGFFIDVGASGATRAIQIESSGAANFPVGLSQGGNQVLHAGNYTSYSPSLTGTGASGTWGISISGTASYATNVSNGRFDNYSGSYNNAYTWIQFGSSGGYGLYFPGSGAMTHFYPNSPSTYGSAFIEGAKNSYWGIMYNTGAGNAGWMTNSNTAGYYTHGYGWKYYHESGAFYISSSTYGGGNAYVALHAGNYTSFSPSLTGSGASGTWSINVTGSAGSASTASSSSLLSALGNYVWSTATSPASYNQGIQCSFVYSGWQSYGSVMTMKTYSGGGGSLQLYVPYSPTYGGTGLQVRFGNYDAGDVWTSWKTLLASDNYTNYAVGVTYNTSLNSDTRNSRGVTRLYRRDSDSDYSVQTYWTGSYWRLYGYYGDSGHADTQVGYADGAARATRANGNFYIDDNYGNSIVGAYASTRYQGVFAMGDSYKLPADGTSTGSLYGMAWSHPNAGGAAGNLDSHGMLVLINGGFGSCMSYSIKASANVTAYSDERLKTNWRSMPDNYVTRLAQVKVGIYDRTDVDQITQVGVGAQSLQALLPEAVITADDEIKTLSVAYGNAALASAVELAKEIVKLREEIELLKAKLN